MKYLLDTHILLWSFLDPSRLTGLVVRELTDPDNQLWYSPISLWEILVLAERGRIVLRDEPEQWLRTVLRSVPMQEAPLNAEVALRSRSVDLPHQDSGDRFIAATALVYGLTLITADHRLLDMSEIHILANK